MPEGKEASSSATPAAAGRGLDWVDSLGKVIVDACVDVREYGVHLVRTLRCLHQARRGAVLMYCFSTGIEAVPILLLIGFLMGLILAMQASEQLSQFGALIFVADLVGVAMTREIGPLITGILVAGRSAAGFAAEVGAMKINMEVKALKTMGLDVHRYLFVPKFIAAILVMPFLTVLTDGFGIFGGFMLGVSTLHLSPRAYIQETIQAVDLADFWTGLVKSMFFGAVIALVGAVKGIHVENGAPEVGRAARNAVVVSIVLIIVLDAVFTGIFHAG